MDAYIYLYSAVLVLLGCFAGFAAGLLGVGGGLIIVPVLIVLFNHADIAPENAVHVAIGTSLATIMLTSISSTLAHHKHRAVEWAIVKRLAPGIAIGAFCGALLASGMPNEALKRTFAFFEILIALQMWIQVQPGTAGGVHGVLPLTLIGSAIGAVSALIGIGGGTMTVPYLNWRGVLIHRAIATSAACGVPIAVVGSVSYWVLGNVRADIELDAGFIYWPAFIVLAISSWLVAPWGARVSHILPRAVLRRIFSVLLLLLGVFMLVY